MTKILMIIAQQGFQDIEFSKTKEQLENAGLETVVAAPTTKTARGSLGMEFVPQLSFEKIKPEDYQALVFIGGPGAAAYIDNEFLENLAKTFKEQGKVIGAICIAPAILAKAGLLKGVKATCHESGAQYLEDGDVKNTQLPVETDQNIVTANGPQAAEEFGKTLAGLLT